MSEHESTGSRVWSDITKVVLGVILGILIGLWISQNQREKGVAEFRQSSPR